MRVKNIGTKVATSTTTNPVEQKEIISIKGKLTEELKTGSYYRVIDIASNSYMEGELESIRLGGGINIFEFTNGSIFSDKFPKGLKFIEIPHPNPIPENSILFFPNPNDKNNAEKFKGLEAGKKYKVIQPKCDINRTGTLKGAEWVLGYPILYFKGIKRHIDVCLGKVALVPKDTN